MTLPSFVASSVFDAVSPGNGTSLVCTRPAAWVSGGVGLICLYKENNGAVTLPGGWVQIATINSAANFWYYVFRKVLGGSEPATYTFSWTGSVWREGGGLSILNADQTTPENVTSTVQANAASLTITAPAITPTVSNTLLVVFGGNFADESFTANTGMTLRSATAGRACCFATETGPASGVSSGTNTFTATGSAVVNVGVTVAIQEVQSAAVIPPGLGTSLHMSTMMQMPPP